MLLFKINRKSETPIYRQIIQQIIELIEKDSLENGTILPSTRELARKQGINRTTIYRAYQELAALGYVESRPGSYTRVRKRPRLFHQTQQSSRSIIDWSEQCNPPSEELYRFFLSYSPEGEKEMPEGLINLSSLDPDSRLFPVKDFRRCLNQVLVNQGAKVLRYGEYGGYRPLREDIAQRLQIHGISISPDEILITNGAQQAIELILKLFAQSGKSVAIESPTYANVLPLIRHHQLQVVEIPMGEEGMDLDMLKSRLEAQRPLFLYTIPNFHNPTGVTTSQAHRETVLEICERYRVPVVEDGFEEEMKYFGKVVLPIKSMDKNQIVLYLGTFSKVLFPGIRIGWIAAERECIRRLLAIKRFVDLSGSSSIQAALSSFLRQGYYDLHLKRIHRIFRKRMQVALSSLKAYLPENFSWTSPDGGYTIWVKSEQPFPEEGTFKQTLIKHGVLVSPGQYYYHSSPPRNYFRIAIAGLNEKEISQGIRRLGDALRALN
ncbi:MAG: PLP-dependent aminotransferase family protein [Calditrichia bacterium]